MGTAGIGAARAVGGAVDFFLKIDGIEGESQDSKHKNEIQLESYDFSATQAITTGTTATGFGAGKVRMSEFKFTKLVDKASPKLFLACATGEHIKKAVLVCRKAGKEQQEYLTITLSDLLVSSYQLTGGEGEGHPADEVGFNFVKMDIEYKEQKPDGTLGGATKAGYDLKIQKAS